MLVKLEVMPVDIPDVLKADVVSKSICVSENGSDINKTILATKMIIIPNVTIKKLFVMVSLR